MKYSGAVLLVVKVFTHEIDVTPLVTPHDPLGVYLGSYHLAH